MYLSNILSFPVTMLERTLITVYPNILNLASKYVKDFGCLLHPRICHYRQLTSVHLIINVFISHVMQKTS